MSNTKQRLERPYEHKEHAPAITRRELLGRGAISFGATIVTPSVLGLMSQKAYGQDGLVCKSDAGGAGGARMIPFIAFDLAGGANIAGSNVWVGGKGGQSDALPAGSYATVGLAPEQEPGAVQPVQELGLWFHPASNMLRGIVETTQATTRAGVEGALFCSTSGDDTRGNPHNPLHWIARAGLDGELVSLVGTSNGPSGGRAAAPAVSINPAKTPSTITRPQDALGLVDPGKLATLLSSADVKKVLDATKTMSEARLRQFQAQDLPTQVRDLIRCGYLSGSDLLTKYSDPARLNAALDPDVTGTFNGIAANADEAKAGTIAKLVLEGYAGAGVVELGGYDYHGQGRATQDRRDLEAGRMIGRTLELAARKNTPVMIYVFTDGGVSARAAGAVNGIFPFVADSGERGAAFALVYKPGGEGRPEIRNGQRQIGAFQPGGAVDTTVNKMSTSPLVLTQTIVANYLALHGREKDIAKVLGDDPFGGDIGRYLAFNRMV